MKAQSTSPGKTLGPSRGRPQPRDLPSPPMGTSPSCFWIPGCLSGPCAQASGGQGGRKELNAAAPGLKKPRLLFSWLLLEHSPLVPDELGGARMTFLASAFNSLGSPRSQPWHLVLASSPGLLSLGEVAWQRHPSWEKMTKESLREKGRK